MPTPPVSLADLRAILDKALSPAPFHSRGVYSGREHRQLLRLLEADGAGEAHVLVVIEAFREAIQAGALRLDPLRRRRVQALMATLERQGRLPDSLPRPGVQSDWITVLEGWTGPNSTIANHPVDIETDPTDLDPTEPLARWAPLQATTPSGAALAADPRGHLRLGTLDLDPHSEDTDVDALLEALWTLCRTPDPWSELPEPGATALAGALARRLSGPLGLVPEQGPTKLQAAGVIASACLLLTARPAALGPHLAALRPRLGESGHQQPALQALLHAALTAAGATGLPTPPEGSAALVDRISQLRQTQATLKPGSVAYALHPETTATYLCATCFCRHEQAWTDLASGHPTFARIHPSTSSAGPLDPVERATLLSALEEYIEDSTTQVFSMGLWHGVAAKAVATVLNAEATAPLLPPGGSLAQTPPRAGAVELTADQAAWLAQNLDLVRDSSAVVALTRGLEQVTALTAGAPGAPPAGPSSTGFELFKRVHAVIRNTAQGNEDGRHDYKDLSAQLTEAIGALSTTLRAHLEALAERPPRFGTVEVPASLVPFLQALLLERVASERSVGNLEEALWVWSEGATRRDPSLPARLPQSEVTGVQAFLQGYLDMWPTLQCFDFNKLGRLALAAATGDTQPLCAINGEAVNPGTFHVDVGRAVKAALAEVAFPQAWMAHRFGYRAKQCIELVDLLAEQQARGLGPLPALFTQGATVRVIATTSDLFYNLLVFGVDHSELPTRWLYLDSKGGLQERRQPEDKHRLFEAMLDATGHIDVEIPHRLSVSANAWPIQNPYGLGDTIDVESYDRQALDKLVETERFETRYKVVQGTIVAYDVHGNHEVRWRDEDGSEQTASLSYEQIRASNNPHYVDERGGRACSTIFELDRDEVWAKDLAKMEEIGRRTGLVDHPLELSELQLATRQKAFLKELNAFHDATMKYPRDPPVDEHDRAYHDRLSYGDHPAGDYIGIERGVCRHMFIREHMGKQRCGIDERFASGAANTYSGAFRGLHIWGEVSLADRARLAHDNPEPRDTRYLSDATWKDPYVPLWSGAYGKDLRRIEMYNRTNYRAHMVVSSG